MHRQFSSTFNIANEQKRITMDNWYKTNYMFNFGNFKKNLSISPKAYIRSLNKKEVNETKLKNELKRKRIEDDIFDMEDILKLIIDISDEAYRYQNKTKKEFVNLPEYKNWIELFIEGKSCIKNNDLINMNLIKKDEDDDDEESENGNKKNKKKKKTNRESIEGIKKVKRYIIKRIYLHK